MAQKAHGRTKQHTFHSTVDLNGVLTTSVRAELVTEFVKHVLYQRQQTSMPFEEIRRDVEKQHTGIPRLVGRQNVDLRKKKALVDGMSALTKSLTEVFGLSTSVRSVIVLLGSSVVSAKETYQLQFPTSIFDGRVLSLKHCKAALFKQLVSSAFFDDVEAPKSCTKLHVVVELLEPVNCDLKVVPQPSYKRPPRASSLELEFVCHSKVVSGDLTRCHDVDFDISGVEPFNGSVLEHQGSADMSLSSPGLLDHSTNMDLDATPGQTCSPMVCETPSHDEDLSLPYSYFLLPVSVEGVRDAIKPTVNGIGR